MRTLRLTLAYDGTNFAGWQRQVGQISVQQRVEEAFAPFAAGHEWRPSVAGASRTDAGVHASAQVASLDFAFDFDVAAIRRALNVRLPPDIRVLDVEEAAPGFHARFDAVGKSYRYRIVTAPILSPFDRWCVWHAPGRYDVDAMRRSAAALVGRHDFRSFQARGTLIAQTTRTITRLELTDLPGELIIDIAGDGFLRHMVRIMVGTLMDVGSGLRRPDTVPAILEVADRRRAGPTVPAAGLMLTGVQY